MSSSGQAVSPLIFFPEKVILAVFLQPECFPLFSLNWPCTNTFLYVTVNYQVVRVEMLMQTLCYSVSVGFSSTAHSFHSSPNDTANLGPRCLWPHINTPRWLSLCCPVGCAARNTEEENHFKA